MRSGCLELHYCPARTNIDKNGGTHIRTRMYQLVISQPDRTSHGMWGQLAELDQGSCSCKHTRSHQGSVSAQYEGLIKTQIIGNCVCGGGVNVCVCGYVCFKEMLVYSEQQNMRTSPKNGVPWGVRRRNVKGQQATDEYTHRDTKACAKGIYAKVSERDAGWEATERGREGERKKGWSGRESENTRWKMRLPSRQASDDTTHSQCSRALGIHREFWVMRSDMLQLTGPLTGCSDWAQRAHGGGGGWVATEAPDWPWRFLEAACEIAAYVGLSWDWGR